MIQMMILFQMMMNKANIDSIQIELIYCNRDIKKKFWFKRRLKKHTNVYDKVKTTEKI